ncbi:MAG: thioredoxin domain-containing protein [Acidimicrobiia bacterium]
MANRLADATSPYLLQHRDNPVDWYEWGEDAFAVARERDVPVLLSVGYAACHWCHVMAHESFEDAATAELMNRWFVNVKVDREERPDVDRVYMDVVQMMTGRGGWPMTVFLTPEAEPFYAGTYFPPTDRYGHPSFTRVLEAVHEAWEQRRGEIEGQAERLRTAVAAPALPDRDQPDEATLAAVHDGIAGVFDATFGGFGTAPKFPQASTLEFLLRSAGRPWAPQSADMLAVSLTAMHRGGIHDRVGGGFARYSVDRRWLVPHFEKMLYDNALLARLYARASQVTGSPRFESAARSTLAYMESDLSLPGGGFASSEDADSEGEEGRFYVFDHDEVARAAGDAAPIALRALGVTPEGNFEGRSIVHEPVTAEEMASELDIGVVDVEAAVAATLRALGELRARRQRPGLDDKAVCAWNGLAVRAFAAAGSALADPALVERSRAAAAFILTELRREDGRLVRSTRAGRHSGPGFCDDYAAVAVGLFSLYRATGEGRWFEHAAEITADMVDLFWDADHGGFFTTGSDAERLIARPKNLFDNPTPSDNALAAEALQHMAALTGEDRWHRLLDDVLRMATPTARRHPDAFAHLMSVALVSLAPPTEVAVVGPDRGPLTAIVRGGYRPEVFLAEGDDDDTVVPLLRQRPTIDGRATAYACRGWVCDAPTTDPTALKESLPPPITLG